MPDKTTLGSHLQLGEKYCIRTITNTFTGQLDKIGEHELILSNASWITDIGRFDEIQVDAEAFKGVEPIIHPLIINRAAIVDVTVIEELPTIRKAGKPPKPPKPPKNGKNDKKNGKNGKKGKK